MHPVIWETRDYKKKIKKTYVQDSREKHNNRQLT